MYRWFKDGIQLENSRKHQILSNVETGILTLTIKTAEEADLGQYQCEVSESFTTVHGLLHIKCESQYSLFVFMIQLLNEVGSAKCKAELCPPAPLAVTASTQKQSQTAPTPGRMKGKVNSNCLRQRRQEFAHKDWWAQ